MEIKTMMLTQITLMNLSRRQRIAAEMSMAEYEREIKRRLWTRRLKTAGEIFGSIFAFLSIVALIWAFIALTPTQRSAEADLVAVQMEAR
jgi:hypothetical protein